MQFDNNTQLIIKSLTVRAKTVLWSKAGGAVFAVSTRPSNAGGDLRTHPIDSATDARPTYPTYPSNPY